MRGNSVGPDFDAGPDFDGGSDSDAGPDSGGGRHFEAGHRFGAGPGFDRIVIETWEPLAEWYGLEVVHSETWRVVYRNPARQLSVVHDIRGPRTIEAAVSLAADGERPDPENAIDVATALYGIHEIDAPDVRRSGPEPDPWAPGLGADPRLSGPGSGAAALGTSEQIAAVLTELGALIAQHLHDVLLDDQAFLQLRQNLRYLGPRRSRVTVRRPREARRRLHGGRPQR